MLAKSKDPISYIKDVELLIPYFVSRILLAIIFIYHRKVNRTNMYTIRPMRFVMVCYVVLGIWLTTIAVATFVIMWFAICFICSAIYEKNTYFGGIRRDEADLSEESDSNNRHRAAATALSNNGRQQRE